ncbi:zf-HC2 domain-containing protein, partial [Brevibacillus borstelensis]|uniref:zf-HC2 domain-containing protein n=1 Tax=Brevibacillus borstelensis TaxID=45462 RepID=UPI0030BBAEC6
MKCHKSDKLKSYFDGKLSPLASAELEQHVDQCVSCQEGLARIMDGTPVAEELLAEELLSPHFTELVMEDIARQEKSRNKRKMWKKRSIDIMKKTAIAVAGLTAAVTFGTMVSPTFANYVNSLFNTVKDVDGGLKQAAVEG